MEFKGRELPILFMKTYYKKEENNTLGLKFQDVSKPQMYLVWGRYGPLWYRWMSSPSSPYYWEYILSHLWLAWAIYGLRMGPGTR